MVPFNPQKYYDSQIATIKNQLANWDFSGAAQTVVNTNSNLGPWGMRLPDALTDINGYIAKMSPEEKAQYQKLEEANKLLAAGNNGNNGLRATKSDVANNLSAQQIANNKVIGYWSNESEAYSRVINAINTSPEKIKFIRDEGGNLAITTGEHPGYDTLSLTPTGQKGVYQFTTYNQVAGGNISGALIADPETGKVAPIINAASQFAYTPGQPGSWVRNTVGGLLGGISDLFGSLGPLGTLALAYVTGGAGAAIGEALGLSGTAAAVAGNTIINTALNGGDVGKALTSSLTSLAGAEAGGLAGDFAKAGELGSFMKDNPQYASMLASAATRTAAQGGDIESAIKNATLGIATDAATSQIDGFKDLPPAVQNTVKSSIQAELQGKDVNVEGTIKNAAVNGLTSYALSQNDDFKNLDPKAQTLVANQISAGLQGKDLSSEAIKWAMNQGNQEIAKAVKGTPESEINQILDMPATPAAAPDTGPVPEPTTEPAPEPDVAKQLEDAGLSEVIPTSVDTAPMTQQQVDELVGLPQEMPATATEVPQQVTPSEAAPSAAQEATPSDDFFRSIGIEPSSMTDQAPMSQEEIDALIGTLPEAEKQPTPTTGGVVTNAPASTTTPSQTTSQTAAQPSTTQEAAQKPQLSSDELLSLMQLLYPQQTGQAAQEEIPLSDVQVGGPTGSVNYLGELARAPNYLGEDQLSEEDKAMLETIGLSPDEISNILEASGMKGSGAIKPGMGVPEGTFKPAGSRTYDIYRALEKDPAMAAKIHQLPLAGFSDDYTKQFISSAEQALNPAWATYRPGVEVAKSFQPPLSQGDARTAAYVPKYDVNTYTGFKPEKYGASSATTPETIGLVTTNPAYLSDPTAAANLMAHELTHIKQVDPNFLLMEAGGTQQDKQSFAKDLATAMPYLQQKYGYAGGYDTQANAPMSERFADLMGWQFQNNIDFSTDPKFQQMVLNTPERMAAWNASTVPRTTRLDPRDLPPGKIVESDFGLPGAAPKSWLVQQLIRSLLGKQ